MGKLALRAKSRSLARFWDPPTETRFEFHRPSDSPELWSSYLSGAAACYRAHGVEAALDLPAIESGATTKLFVAGIDLHGDVVAGLRVHGPLREPSEAHVLSVFAGAPEVHRLLEQRIPFGAIEIRGCWVERESVHRSELSNALARCYVHAMSLLDVEFACCSAAIHALHRWQTSGGQTVPGLASVPYPDDRYETTMLWWTRSSVDRHADEEQWRRICAEQQQQWMVEAETAGEEIEEDRSARLITA